MGSSSLKADVNAFERLQPEGAVKWTAGFVVSCFDGLCDLDLFKLGCGQAAVIHEDWLAVSELTTQPMNVPERGTR
jgi:hypothetical protein